MPLMCGNWNIKKQNRIRNPQYEKQLFKPPG